MHCCWKLQTLGSRTLLKCRAFHTDDTLSFLLNLLGVVLREILIFFMGMIGENRN